MNFKEEFEKMLDERIIELNDRIDNGYLPEDIRKEKQDGLDFLFQLRKALFKY